MHAIVCVTVKLSRVFLHYNNDGKIEEFIGCYRFPDLYVYFKQISVEKKSQLYCELLDNITFCASFNLTLRINYFF